MESGGLWISGQDREEQDMLEETWLLLKWPLVAFLHNVPVNL